MALVYSVDRINVKLAEEAKGGGGGAEAAAGFTVRGDFRDTAYWKADVTTDPTKLFREGAKAIEQEKLDEVMAKVSFNYTDEYGLTYLYVREVMTRVFQRMDGIKIEYEIVRIDIKDTRATAELDIRVIASQGSDTGYAVGDAARPAHMTFTLEKERTTWLVVRTEGLPLNF